MGNVVPQTSHSPREAFNGLRPSNVHLCPPPSRPRKCSNTRRNRRAPQDPVRKTAQPAHDQHQLYYWATQEPTPTSQETAEGAGAGPQGATLNAAGKEKETKSPVAPKSGEWAQTVGTFKPAYRPVPARW